MRTRGELLQAGAALSVEPDVESFCYSRLVESGREDKLTVRRGRGIVLHNGSRFLECYSHAIYDLADGGHSIRTGEKVHVSVNPQQLGEAWDTMLPILLRNPEVFGGFKVVKFDKALAEIARCERTLKDPGLGERIRKELVDRMERARRVTDGTQFTLYVYGRPDGREVSPTRCREVIDEITKALRGKGIAPVAHPASDHAVNEYCSFRLDKKLVDGELHDLDPKDPDYAKYYDRMPENRVYKALVK
ncbi:MAG: hypothetical protein HY854_01985 [Burkholderiales bacterium]|nr:hypothetical protein [Burkholderiales bacterium]